MELQDYEREHLDRLRPCLPECTVLLKSNGDFPLAGPGRLALYGGGARHTIKGGTGSGEVNSRFFVTVEQGLRDAGFEITTASWLDQYDLIREQAEKEFIKAVKARARAKHTMAVMEAMGAVMPEPEYELSLNAGDDAGTAVYVLARISGEGSDRQVVRGDILLTDTEVRDILNLQKRYKKFLLVLNVGGPVDLSPVLDVENILVLSQLGVETGSALADLLLGKAYPSGKLTTTWAAIEDYPRVGQFGGLDDTRYREGVYVGYRYFDSVGVKPLFPFGFGLGYTNFSLRVDGPRVSGGEVAVDVRVRNEGLYPGREVVQLYVSPPRDELDKPYQSLAAFAKTKELSPGEEDKVTLRFSLPDISSYQESCAAYMLEQGDYVLRVGPSSQDTEPCAVLRLDESVTVRQVRPCLGKPDFQDWRPDTPVESVYPDGCPVISVDAASISQETADYELSHEVDPVIEGLSDEELIYLNIGAFDPKAGALSIIGNAGSSVAGAAGETAGRLKDQGIPALVMADGPAGLRLSQDYAVDENGVHPLGPTIPEGMLQYMSGPVKALMELMNKKPAKDAEIRHQYAAAIPIGTALAQSWNLELARTCGDIVGAEMERFGVHLWLAPALNIHRNIRCGRNFEYFSEDPLISGLFAAAITQGVQSHPGCGATIKHYAANNQENNRYNSNSQVSERAMREIYLRGFELCVRQSQPHALMTSYNLLNGVHTSEHRGLIEDVLRGEFGYKGIVMTDWVINGGTVDKGSIHLGPQAGRVAAAGGDLMMPGCQGDYDSIASALSSGQLSRRQLEINATRVYRMAKQLNG